MEMQALVERFIPVTITMLEREFPNGILHTLTSHEDVASPRELHPIFFGCFDWHSAVHSYLLTQRGLSDFQIN
ncbi:DUF2891 domain-containing protein [Chloroflexi bacterium TSY]|nr:DUF2891 domain-containing protein [Chloroflexi bacterium TSY]